MSSAYRFTVEHLRPYLVWYVFGFFCILATQMIMVGIIEETRAALDDISVIESSEQFSGPASAGVPKGVVPEDTAQVASKVLTSQPPGGDRNLILPYVYKILVLAILLFFIRILSRYLVFTPGRMIEYTIRNRFFHTLLNKPRSFFNHYETGDLISRSSNDIGFIRAAYGYGVLQVTNVLAAFIFGIWGMWRMDAKTTLFIGIPMFATFVVIQFSIRYLFNHWRRANEQLGQLSNFCLASFQGVSAVQGYHAEPRFNELFTRKSQEYLETNLVITRVRSFVMPLVKFSGNMATFIVLWFIGASIIHGRHSVGQISAYLGYIAMVMPPLLSLGWMMNVFNRAIPAIERLSEIIGLDSTPSKMPECITSPHEEHTLEAVNLGVRFNEGESEFRLKDISLKLQSGKSLGIVGEVGSGKTALVEALLLFNPLCDGELLFDGTPVGVEGNSGGVDPKCHRQWFSFASQRAFLFSASLRDNLLLALGDCGPDRVKSDSELYLALEMAGFSLDPGQFPQGLDTQVGEKGIMLSGGQRQRIALARCFLKDTVFYILDDVLSAVDQETQRTILENLKTRSVMSSFLIVSHRISAVQWCDEILVLEQGSIVDRGSHRELLSRPGYYRSSFEYQSRKDAS